MSEGWTPAADAMPDTRALAGVGRAWATRRSVKLVGGPARGMLAAGEPAGKGGLDAVLRCVFEGFKGFKSYTPMGPVPNQLGPHLWAAGARAMQPEKVYQWLDRPLIPRVPLHHVLTHLPLGQPARLFLHLDEPEKRPLGEALDWIKVETNEIAEDLALLASLGLMKLGEPSQKAPSAGAAMIQLNPARSQEKLLVQRLKKDLERLSGFDDWTLLGLSPGMDQATIERGCTRMALRYHGVAQDMGASDEVREVAGLLDQLIARTTERVSQGRARQSEGRKVQVSPDEAKLEPSQVLEEARVHIEHEDWGTAVKMLNWVRQKRPSDQLVQGLLGWAVFNAPDKEKAKRQKVGFELIELAVSLAPEEEELHILMATCDHIQGRDQDALERCMLIAKRGGERADAARALMRQIRGPRRG